MHSNENDPDEPEKRAFCLPFSLFPSTLVLLDNRSHGKHPFDMVLQNSRGQKAMQREIDGFAPASVTSEARRVRKCDRYEDPERLWDEAEDKGELAYILSSVGILSATS
jgi:hypothetical protein